MKNTTKMQAGILILGGVLLFLGGCGHKTLPVPPQTVVPQPIVDLVYIIDDNGLELSWSFPVKTVGGSAIEDISSFDLYRAEIPLDEYCSNCPIPFADPIEVTGGATVDGEQRRRANYRFPELKSGYKYFFKVTSRTSWLAASPDSNIITFVRLEPAAAPQGLMASSGDRRIALKWQPVVSLADGSPLEYPIKYQVFRSDGGKDFVTLGEAQEETGFVDRQVRNGQKYFYAVQSMLLYQDELVAGDRSEEVSAMSVDLTPPSPPSGVTAIRTGVGIKIFWDKSDAEDLGGYRVYRRAANTDSYQLLGKVEPEYTLYDDRSVDGSVRYYYAVTAIDLADKPNESDKSREATVRY
jgi:hypothetical protein